MWMALRACCEMKSRQMTSHLSLQRGQVTSTIETAVCVRMVVLVGTASISAGIHSFHGFVSTVVAVTVYQTALRVMSISCWVTYRYPSREAT